MYAGGSTGMATLRRDGFVAMTADAEIGALTTRLLSFNGSHLFVNASCAEGELTVEILDEQGKVLSGFSFDDSVPLVGDSTCHRITLKNFEDLSGLDRMPVRFRFQLRQGELYSFWVSKSPRGRSDGYVAAGGPGFDRPTDTVGYTSSA